MHDLAAHGFYSLDKLVQVSETLQGRDKLTKLCQYLAKILVWVLNNNGSNAEHAKRLRNLEMAMQQARKVYRLGRSVVYLKKVQQKARNKQFVKCEQQLELMQNAGLLGYLAYDNISFASSIGFLDIDQRKAAERGGLLWFIGNLAGVFRHVDAFTTNCNQEATIHTSLQDTETDPDGIIEAQQQIDNLQRARLALFLAFIKTSCDLVISSNTSGVRLPERITGKKLNDGVIGLLGCISALLCLRRTWPAQ